MTLLLALACNDPTVTDIEGDEPGECNDGADNDANGDFDCDDAGCAGSPDCGADTGDDGIVDRNDQDGDGYETPEDCDDEDPHVHPGAEEVCNDLDDDCNGLVDDAEEGDTWYLDADGDGFGVEDETRLGCDQPDGYADNALDCDDSEASANPEGTEIDWDGVDQDCDGYDVDLHACVNESVEDATNWVSYWEYDVDDQSGDYWIAGYDLYYQTLYVDASNGGVSGYKDDPLLFDVTVDSQQALNTYEDPFWLDAWFDETWYFCDGYIDWTQVPYVGTVEVHVLDGGEVSTTVNLAAEWDGYVQDDIVLWAYADGGACEVATLDLFLSYAGYDVLSFFDSAFTDHAASIAEELEYEINWYAEYNCSDG